MKTTKATKKEVLKKVNKAIENAKTSAKKANDYALHTTEEVVTDAITVAGQWQKVTEKALKGGVKLLDNQQDLIFNTLESYKKHFMAGKKRFKQIFA